ncbi:hypothetical protein A2715_02610 [Candidatus Woesebacteria bacterium RIFCSPHIGHO2_01_FULL_39_32]|uniref:NodB homology domain-containing protein n=1 Tax=Candidatus Woesebacteria bacterium RIFCSPLOWO2_01_FULL_39_25 TaxID=1802521 RepID=A0A1F8BM89_9BACT|nr:MAG: hypothetical protein A2124_05510 [Candidatus Woesebacteria bacterium GWB1_37_5]OGM24045.1 MAG: hypothetical protein A2715_02610 [Candidatus Woesebacteria bacterium RIFCSPHIGHO2_01_FULL_39_32]OGM38044.1 MAG: hypothetical protein A3F01_05925 [Candidatus Woesebacteria bacterium RIFCSPHIGHO2_12_FULL_38_11]OGM64388.1 MAG: hypothetical protein A2893_00785 [Candidatus Woesebacteria bacterium RIFCSPLOWO2_01_FULL_39_25]
MDKFIITTSWDDGSVEDLRLAQLLAKYEIPATFYVPIRGKNWKVMEDRQIRELSSEFEIGGHTLNHINLCSVSSKVAEKEVRRGKEKLEQVIGKKITSFAYPFGATNKIIKQLVGFADFNFARTIRLFETYVFDKLSAGTTMHAYNNHPLMRVVMGRGRFWGVGSIRKFFNSWDVVCKDYLDFCMENGGIFHLWGHSWEIEKHDNWSRLERIFKYINETTPKNLRCTNREVVSLLEAKKENYYANLDPRKYAQDLGFLNEFTKNYDRKGMRVLDIGCGRGDAAEYYKKASYMGIDTSQKFITYAQKNYRGDSLCEDYRKIPAEKFSKKFDLILILGLFEDHTNPVGEVANICKKFGRKGTKVLFTLHNAKSLRFKLTKAVQSFSGRLKFPHTSFTKEVLQNHFKNIQVEDKGPFLLARTTCCD